MLVSIVLDVVWRVRAAAMTFRLVFTVGLNYGLLLGPLRCAIDFVVQSKFDTLFQVVFILCACLLVTFAVIGRLTRFCRCFALARSLDVDMLFATVYGTL
jgi:hypothetical protein